MSLHDFWGLFGSAVLIAGAVFSLPVFIRLRVWPAVLILCCMLLLPLFGELSPAGYLRGIVGDLSTTTVGLLLSHLLFSAHRGAESRKPLLVIILSCGMALYPFSLGPWQIDPYEWGYHPQVLLVVLAATGILLSRRHIMALYYLTACLLAYALNLSASTNLWDYLLDPLVFGYALWVLVVKPACRLPQFMLSHRWKSSRRVKLADYTYMSPE